VGSRNAEGGKSAEGLGKGFRFQVSEKEREADYEVGSRDAEIGKNENRRQIKPCDSVNIRGEKK
jgi:hypothetical protein